MLTAVRRLCGHPAGGPSGVVSQDTAARSRPTSPPPANISAPDGPRSSSLIGRTLLVRQPPRPAQHRCGGVMCPRLVGYVAHLGRSLPRPGGVTVSSVPGRSGQPAARRSLRRGLIPPRPAPKTLLLGGLSPRSDCSASV